MPFTIVYDNTTGASIFLAKESVHSKMLDNGSGLSTCGITESIKRVPGDTLKSLSIPSTLPAVATHVKGDVVLGATACPSWSSNEQVKFIVRGMQVVSGIGDCRVVERLTNALKNYLMNFLVNGEGCYLTQYLAATQIALKGPRSTGAMAAGSSAAQLAGDAHRVAHLLPSIDSSGRLHENSLSKTATLELKEHLQ
eukprot:CAMPEP_0178380966 /NCGR_PEP_ID=MMETSP0689_2-20121128/5738_1 /TAXON_ID=160604 /ORGANISM="Amphidinium massartii, Strain CS-259" /LENGTH=195 /DNA_ID=CAMNT_0020001131 /DNA_START=192 /DNA_END=778 /DNA_ORIENTATION=+